MPHEPSVISISFTDSPRVNPIFWLGFTGILFSVRNLSANIATGIGHIAMSINTLAACILIFFNLAPNSLF